MSHSDLVECVANFSEGQKREVIDAIAQAITSTEGCTLLYIEASISTNRAVYTFVGSPKDVVEGALNGAKMARQLIDMTQHRGEHPRLGALDVCPFIPIRGVTMEDCIKCANRFAERAAKEIGIPVYLYGHAARLESRRTVPAIRNGAGEYEGLRTKISRPEWKPDNGPAEFIPNWGATIAGARTFVFAYKVSILGTKEQAERIAHYLKGNVRGLVEVIGFWLEEENIAQVSMNLGAEFESPLHIAFEEVVKNAKELNVAVCGSQIVGVVPLKSMLDAAEYYIEKENLFIVTEDQKIRLVIEKLGLSSIYPFQPKERIIEYIVGDGRNLITFSLQKFIFSLGEPEVGSSFSAVSAMGAALSTVVGWMSCGNIRFECPDSTTWQVIQDLRKIMLGLIPLVDDYTSASNICVEAMEGLNKSPQEDAICEKKVQRGLKLKILAQMAVVRKVSKAWPLLKKLAQEGNINTKLKSDLQLGIPSIETGICGANHNIMINMADIKDKDFKDFKDQITQEAEAAVKLAQENCKEILQIVADRK